MGPVRHRDKRVRGPHIRASTGIHSGGGSAKGTGTSCFRSGTLDRHRVLQGRERVLGTQRGHAAAMVVSGRRQWQRAATQGCLRDPRRRRRKRQDLRGQVRSSTARQAHGTAVKSHGGSGRRVRARRRTPTRRHGDGRTVRGCARNRRRGMLMGQHTSDRARVRVQGRGARLTVVHR